MKPFVTLKKRREFIEMTKNGLAFGGPFFVIQIESLPSPSPQWCYGITASKKVGNAVQRNKAKRRLRALYQAIVAKEVQKAHGRNLTLNMVLVAKRALPKAPYGDVARHFRQRLAAYLETL